MNDQAPQNEFDRVPQSHKGKQLQCFFVSPIENLVAWPFIALTIYVSRFGQCLTAKTGQA